MLDLLTRINNLFISVDSQLGDSALAPTGEPYITYALGYLLFEEDNPAEIEFLLEEALFGCFHDIRYPKAFQKPEGSAIYYEKSNPEWDKTRLYWRRYPDIEIWMDDETVQRRMRITCRALISAKPKC